jgi:hypothetical protein
MALSVVARQVISQTCLTGVTDGVLGCLQTPGGNVVRASASRGRIESQTVAEE